MAPEAQIHDAMSFWHAINLQLIQMIHSHMATLHVRTCTEQIASLKEHAMLLRAAWDARWSHRCIFDIIATLEHELLV